MLPINQIKKHAMEHRFQVELAMEYGIEEAILIENFVHWIQKNKANNKHYHNGRYWTYNSAKAFAEQFPYMNESKIKRIVSRLVETGVLMKGNYNENQYDRTCWYAFTDKGFAIVQKCYFHSSKMTNGKVQNELTIPDNNTNNKPYTFMPSIEGGEDRLFDDADTTTLTMLSSEVKNMGAQNGKPTAEELTEWFEDLWLMYERKGSKAKAKKEFEKLSKDEISAMRHHIPAYLQSRPDRQYRLDFERYIKNKAFESVVYSKHNIVLYDPESPDTSSTQETIQESKAECSTTTINGVTYR